VLDPDQLFGDVAYLMGVLLDQDDGGAEDDDRDIDDGLDDEAVRQLAGTGPSDVNGDSDGHRRRRWRLLVLEDCDELIHGDAKKGAGQALSRLLNLTDGMVGQGLDVLICLTTNEDVHRLHPAVTRPGRCLAQVHVGRFPRDEARSWLGRPDGVAVDGVGPDGATLAELYALRGDVRKVDRPEPERAVGQYL
jgi:hypothetical protein